jgi:ABC-type uncharacterized transport system permease subunit
MTALSRLLLTALAAYIVIGVVYATWETIDTALYAKDPNALPAPWSSVMAFLAWFVLPAALWPWNLVGFRGLPEILVASVYLATVGLFYMAASRRSAARHLKSTYPDNH